MFLMENLVGVLITSMSTLIKESMKLKLRPPQLASLVNTQEAYTEGLRRLLIQMPTGMGKTVVFAHLREFFGFKKKVLVLIHKEELAEQAADKLKQWNPSERIGIEMAGRSASWNDTFVVASVPTLGKKDSKRILKFDPDEFDAVICDEAHHAIAPSWVNVLTYFGFDPIEPDPKNRLLVGVTATPNRGDGQAMGQMFDKLVYSYSILDAIHEGWLVDVKGIRVRSDTSLADVHTLRGDFKQDELAVAVDNEKRNALIVHSYEKHAEGRQAIAFTANIGHAKNLAREFNKKGIPAAAIWGNDPERSDKQKAHRYGKLRVLTNCNVLTEGYDDPTISCIILGRPTKSQLLFIQMAGRGTRLPVGINNILEARAAGLVLTKEDCLVIDVVDNTKEHSLVTLPTIFGLPATLDMNGATATKTAAILEEYSEKYPNSDFSDLTDLKDIKAHAERVDLFAFKVPEGIMKASPLMWYRRPDGSYILRLIETHEQVEVFKSLTGHWTVKGSIRQNHFLKDGFESPEKAVVFADSKITVLGRGMLQHLRRGSAKNKLLASQPQWIMINGLCPADQMDRIPKSLTHEDARNLIPQLIMNLAKPKPKKR